MPEPYISYSGNKLSPSSTAIVRGEKKGPNQYILVTCIDGESTDKTEESIFGYEESGKRYPASVIVLPGRRYFSILYSSGLAYDYYVVEFEADAGQEYLIKEKVKGYSINILIENVNTKKMVKRTINPLQENNPKAKLCF
ncbi:hypothetical protein KCM76_22525 [Zooshikella marina]|uniref:hypothetical protein n=1 Tax=Zooshikella ganghwensis TaxID=202772 RepID=UPI001BB0966A|nr:hypothetical protein [Zooshikella ganghwensis]MBU2708786.1 hypothetical protein [Zooshikella ganghwensis]